MKNSAGEITTPANFLHLLCDNTSSNKRCYSLPPSRLTAFKNRRCFYAPEH